MILFGDARVENIDLSPNTVDSEDSSTNKNAEALSHGLRIVAHDSGETTSLYFNDWIMVGICAYVMFVLSSILALLIAFQGDRGTGAFILCAIALIQWFVIPFWIMNIGAGNGLLGSQGYSYQSGMIFGVFTGLAVGTTITAAVAFSLTNIPEPIIRQYVDSLLSQPPNQDLILDSPYDKDHPIKRDFQGPVIATLWIFMFTARLHRVRMARQIRFLLDKINRKMQDRSDENFVRFDD